VLECVVNVSEGQDASLLDRLSEASGSVLDRHADRDHHRSVFTLTGTDAPRQLTASAFAELDLRRHHGVHPRFGVVDVVPFVPLWGTTMAEALMARDNFAEWAASTYAVPCFLYGPQRSLPEVRREAFSSLAPDRGPGQPHPRFGAIAVGARHALVAYNLWLDANDLDLARSIAAGLRSETVRVLALRVDGRVQVSCNLVEPNRTRPDHVYDAVARLAPIERAELVGLVPASVLVAIDHRRWAQLDVSPNRTIEARVAQAV
jgi:glutamate formiminotransferase